MSQEYDNHYGDGDEAGQRRNYMKRMNGLGWKIKALAVAGTICSLGMLAFCVVQQLNIENLSDTGTQHSDQVGCIILHTIIFINFFMKSIKRLIWKYLSFKK